MCSRSRWENESIGHMDLSLFDKVIDEIPDGVKRIFFGGVGEPFCHPDIMYMIRRAKETGRIVEAITNGTLLDEEMSEKIVETKLDMLWLSLDSLEKENYEKIRSGANFSSVYNNIQTFNEKRFPYNWLKPPYNTAKVKLGIVFVLMKSNIKHFKELLTKAPSLGIAQVMATHLMPYNKSQLDQICYERILGLGMYGGADDRASVFVDMPLIDTDDIQKYNMLTLPSNPVLSFSIMGTSLIKKTDYCKFVQEGLVFLRWDGEVCPCMAFLHENKVYQQGLERSIKPCSYGNANRLRLLDIWESEAYTKFRQRVIDFKFPPCITCGTCEDFITNEKDCFSNAFPSCAACLWAQGLFQCP